MIFFERKNLMSQPTPSSTIGNFTGGIAGGAYSGLYRNTPVYCQGIKTGATVKGAGTKIPATGPFLASIPGGSSNLYNSDISSINKYSLVEFPVGSTIVTSNLPNSAVSLVGYNGPTPVQ